MSTLIHYIPNILVIKMLSFVIVTVALSRGSPPACPYWPAAPRCQKCSYPITAFKDGYTVRPKVGDMLGSQRSGLPNSRDIVAMHSISHIL